MRRLNAITVPRCASVLRGALDMPLLPNQRLHLQREVCFLLRPMLKPRTKKAKSTGIRTDRSNKLQRGARS